MPGDGYSSEHWPTQICLRKAEKILQVTFDDGKAFDLPAELLRVESPSAEVQGHVPDQKKTVHGRRRVGIMELEPVGNYAIRIKFDDLHDTGIYSWQYLYKLATEQDQLWSQYLQQLEQAGQSRIADSINFKSI